jgi:hypothetical protein
MTAETHSFLSFRMSLPGKRLRASGCVKPVENTYAADRVVIVTKEVEAPASI